MSYYNTNNETGGTLSISWDKTSKQKKLIYDIFAEFYTLAPHQVKELLKLRYDVSYPLTSVRRAITDLTAESLLVKTDVMIDGNYGKKVHTWRLA
tara:strand:+ start:5508 stop:5792 length:285 start_codon:yes stop_codon:yes gene_type:complete